MQHDFTRQFSFALADGIEMTVKYSGVLSRYLDIAGIEYVAEVVSIDGFAVNGQTFLSRKLDGAIEEVLFDKAYDDADDNLGYIVESLDDAMIGVQ